MSGGLRALGRPHSAGTARAGGRAAAWSRLAGRYLPPLVVVALATAAVVPAVAVPGLLATRAAGDSPFLLVRVQQMAAALGAGHVPPRWMPDAAFGLGYPFWNFYAPLAYLLPGLVVTLGGGIVGAIKLSTWLWFVVAGAGAYLLGRDTWDEPAAGVVAAAAYTLAPYHLVNVYVRGDALAELAAYGLFPWLLWQVDRTLAGRTSGAVVGLAVLTALLLVSHNISALLFSPLLLAYVVWRGLRGSHWPAKVRRRLSRRAPSPPAPAQVAPVPARRRVRPAAVRSNEAVVASGAWMVPAAWTLQALLVLEHHLWPWRPGPRLRGGLAVIAGLTLGALLAAWFWLPALAESGAVHLEDNLQGYFHFAGHFRGLDLIDPRPLFDYAVREGCTPCRNGLVQLVVAALGILTALWHRRARGPLVFWLAIALASTLMITALSAPLWGLVPLLEYAQFPWRWLSVQSLALAMLSAPLATGRWRWPVAAVAVAALAAATLSRLPVQTLAVDQVTAADLTAYEIFSGNIGATVRHEYLPRAVMPPPSGSAEAAYGHVAGPRVVAGNGVVTSAVRNARQADRQTWRVQLGGGPASVAFPIYGFPGWTAAVNGQPPQPAGTFPGSGWLTVEVDPADCTSAGDCTVVLELGRSAVRALAESVSLLALLLLLLLWLVDRRHRVWPLLLGLAVVLALAVLVSRRLPAGAERGPVSLDFVRSPYPHHNPDGLRFDPARLVEATLQAPGTEDKGRPILARVGQDLLVDLRWQDPQPGWRVEAALVGPAEPLLDVPDIRARAEQPMGAPDTLALTIPDDIASGLYFVRLRLTDHGEPVTPRDASGQELGTVYLGPVRVHGAGFPPDAAVQPLAVMGDVTLHELDTAQADDKLEVKMVWSAIRPLGLDYKTSVRLVDAGGKVVAQDDNMPLYGFFPTTAWPPNEKVVDRRWLELPNAIERGEDYTVEVVMYEETPGDNGQPGWRELGRRRVEGVSLGGR
jgi:hypothetical protein